MVKALVDSHMWQQKLIYPLLSPRYLLFRWSQRYSEGKNCNKIVILKKIFYVGRASVLWGGGGSSNWDETPPPVPRHRKNCTKIVIKKNYVAQDEPVCYGVAGVQ
jgi:hypothetical protein